MRTLTGTTSVTALALASLAFLISGCVGDFSYKRGAGMSDFQQEREHCADQKKTEYEIEQCLEKAGWLMVGTDKDPDTRQIETAINPKDTTIVVVEETIEMTTSPIDKVTITSWWKAGAGPHNLLADGNICALKLGEGHKPEVNMSIVTTGLINCMKNEGWFALKAN